MRRLAQAPNLAIATLWVHALREDGVAASVQREYLGAAAGQLPPDQCLPEIWIEDEAQFELRRAVCSTPCSTGRSGAGSAVAASWSRAASSSAGAAAR